MELRFLYIGSSSTARDVEAWLRVPGARLRWRFQSFGADVAAIDLGSPPLLLVADHRPPGTILPIYSVEDPEAVLQSLDGQGWSLEMGPLGTPEGPAWVLADASGGTIALLRLDRPGMLDTAYASDENTRAVRPPAP